MYSDIASVMVFGKSLLLGILPSPYVGLEFSHKYDFSDFINITESYSGFSLRNLMPESMVEGLRKLCKMLDSSQWPLAVSYTHLTLPTTSRV